MENCPVCNKKIIMGKHEKTYCSVKCKKIAYRKRVYEKNDGNWEWYFKGILNNRDDRKQLTPKILIKILEKQNYKCALSGVEMTCTRVQGKTHNILTNASIDRIIPGKGYNIDNVQLVCKAINSFRNSLSVKQYIKWCEKVVNYAVQK